MDRLIDVASVVIFISMIMYAAIKLDEGDRIAQGIFHRYYKVDGDKTDGDRTGGIGSTGK